MERLLYQYLTHIISFNFHTNSRNCGDCYPHFADQGIEAHMDGEPKESDSRAPPLPRHPELPLMVFQRSGWCRGPEPGQIPSAPQQCTSTVPKGADERPKLVASSFQSTSCQNPEIRGEGPGGRSWHSSPILSRFSRSPVGFSGPVRGAFPMSRKQGASGVEIGGCRGQGRTLAWE